MSAGRGAVYPPPRTRCATTVAIAPVSRREAQAYHAHANSKNNVHARPRLSPKPKPTPIKEQKPTFVACQTRAPSPHRPCQRSTTSPPEMGPATTPTGPHTTPHNNDTPSG